MISDALAKPDPLVREVLGEHYEQAERFPLPHGWSGAAVMEPGATLSADTQKAILRSLVPVSTAAFGADMTEYWRDRSANNYFSQLNEFVVIAGGDGRMVGWTGHSVLGSGPRVIVYIDSSGVVPSGQSRGVMRAVMARRLTNGVLAQLRSRRWVYVSARSESPVFYKLMRGLVGVTNLFPNPDLLTPVDVLECGQELAEWLGQAALMETRSLVIRNAYAMLDELYGELPSSSEPTLDRMFRNSLGPLDAYLLIGRIPTEQDEIGRPESR